MKQIYFTVTNDLGYDQRMDRICGSLASAGYDITIVGRKLKHSTSLQDKEYNYYRIYCFFTKGFLFYAEYNLKLFFFLLTKRMDGICAIDLDTILPCILLSKAKKIPCVYDAHEYFTEQKEVRTRPGVKKIWKIIERFAVPKCSTCYTVSEGLARIFSCEYSKTFDVIRNVPLLKPLQKDDGVEHFLFYGGAVNEARGLEYLVPAIKTINCKLVICGDGNFMDEVKHLIADNNLGDKVILKGMVSAVELWQTAQKATIGINLVEREGLNQYYSLANKFFDYIQAGLPQVSMNFPEYKAVNDQYRVAVLLEDLSTEAVAVAINELLANQSLLKTLKENALRAREVYCWQHEEKNLITIYNKTFGIA